MSSGFHRYGLPVIRWCFHFIFAAGLTAVFGAGAASAYSVDDKVLHQLQSDEQVDLGNKELDAQFLEALLRGQIHNLTILRDRIRIRHAVIRSLDLRNAKVPYSVSLSDCVFETEVILENAVFEQDVGFESSKFEKGADFINVHVRGTVSVDGARFDGPADFESARVGHDLFAVGAVFKTNADFADIHVDGLADFDGAGFDGPVDFTGGKIEESLLVRKAIFSTMDFSSGRFESEKKDPGTLCAAMGSAAEIKSGRDPCIQWLNEQLERPDLFEQISAAKPGLTLPVEMEKLRTKTQDSRRRPFKDLGTDAKEEIKRLNRLTIELRWPMEAPKRSEAIFRANALVTGLDLNLDGAVFTDRCILIQRRSGLHWLRVNPNSMEERIFPTLSCMQTPTSIRRSSKGRWISAGQKSAVISLPGQDSKVIQISTRCRSMGSPTSMTPDLAGRSRLWGQRSWEASWP